MTRDELKPYDRCIGAAITREREVQDMTISDLAAKLGLSYQQVQKYELGENCVTASRLQHIAFVLGVKPQVFFPDVT